MANPESQSRRFIKSVLAGCCLLIAATMQSSSTFASGTVVFDSDDPQRVQTSDDAGSSHTRVGGPAARFEWLRRHRESQSAGSTALLRADPSGEPPDSDQADADADDNDKKKDEKEGDRYFAIVGGTVHTVSGPVLNGVTILTKNGRIKEVGRHVRIPDGAEVLDATGHRVYPGLVAVRSFGLVGRDPVEDTSDVYSLNTITALAGGITTAVSGSTAAKLLYGTTENMEVGTNLFVNISYSTSNPRGRQQLRQQFDRLIEHQRQVEEHRRREARGEESEAPDDRWIRGQLANYNRLLKREAVALASAETAHDLLQLCELADRYGISIVAQGAREGWVVAPELARSGIRVIITPRVRSDRDPRRLMPTGSSIENAAILHRHGVPLAIISSSPGIGFGGLAGRDLLHLTMEAAFGVRGGLPEDAAIRAITLDAAKILGIDHRVGSIEVGKDADFIVTDGDLLHYMTHVRWTVVNGRIMYDKMKETLFDHIRPDGDWDAPPPDDHWPRRLGAEW